MLTCQETQATSLVPSIIEVGCLEEEEEEKATKMVDGEGTRLAATHAGEARALAIETERQRLEAEAEAHQSHKRILVIMMYMLYKLMC